MSKSRRSRIVLPLVVGLTAFALSAQAEESNKPPVREGQAKPAVQAARPAPAHAPARRRAVGRRTGATRAAACKRCGSWRTCLSRRRSWEGRAGGAEAHNGRNGWWWDVGASWYFYPQRLEGPPAYVVDPRGRGGF